MQIIHIYNQSMQFDIRTRRYADALTKHYSNLNFQLVGQQDSSEQDAVEILSDRSKITRLPLYKFPQLGKIGKLLGFALWNLRVFIYALFQTKLTVVSAHSLKVLPVTTLIATLKRAKLFYDTHEIETHTTGSSPAIRVLTILERLCIGFVKKIIVTSPGHANWYQEQYSKPVHLIRNCPSLEETQLTTASEKYDLKKILGLKKEVVLCVYVGIINNKRGCGVILEAFNSPIDNTHILFLGFGDVDPILKLAEKRSDVHYLKPVPPLELIKYLKSADIGIHMMDSSSLNHKKALPNKPMQYMAAGLASIVSDVEVMSELIKEAGSGVVVPEGDSSQLRKTIETITTEQLKSFQAAAEHWFKNNNWELESEKLEDLYDL